MRFQNRTDAGRQLAIALSDYRSRPDTLLLALPRGGVPVAAEIAEVLDLPMDVMLVRKLGLPGQEELAMGAIALGDTCVLNDDVIALADVPETMVQQVKAMQRIELERRNDLYRGGRPAPDLSGKTVILIDDGLATGATMRAAVAATRQAGAKEIIAALPVGASESCEALAPKVDRLVCLDTPFPFFGVGQWYVDFSQTSDDEVVEALNRLSGQGKVPPSGE